MKPHYLIKSFPILFLAFFDFLVVVFDLLFLVFQRPVQPDLLKKVELVDEKDDHHENNGGVDIAVVEFA